MKISIIKQFVSDGKVNVKFKYWNDNDCACLAKIAIREFDTFPTHEQIISSI